MPNTSKIFDPSEDVIQIVRFTSLQPNRKRIPSKMTENCSVRKVTLVRRAPLIGKQVYTSALLAIRCTPVHSWQLCVHQCTMGKQVILSFLAYRALWASRFSPVHNGQAGDTQLFSIQCTKGKQVYNSAHI